MLNSSPQCNECSSLDYVASTVTDSSESELLYYNLYSAIVKQMCTTPQHKVIWMTKILYRTA
jgi:hypothetical protein